MFCHVFLARSLSNLDSAFLSCSTVDFNDQTIGVHFRRELKQFVFSLALHFVETGGTWTGGKHKKNRLFASMTRSFSILAHHIILSEVHYGIGSTLARHSLDLLPQWTLIRNPLKSTLELDQ